MGVHIGHIKNFIKFMLKYLMKNFPEYGLTFTQPDEVVRASALFDICHYHHARWGDNGYPDYLVGEMTGGTN